MIRVIRVAGLALVLACVLVVSSVGASDAVVIDDAINQEALTPGEIRGQETTIQYGDPDDISGNRGNAVVGTGVEMSGILANGTDDPAVLLFTWIMYLDLLSL